MNGAVALLRVAGAIMVASARDPINRVATFPLCKMFDTTCNDTSTITPATICASDDGRTLIYTDTSGKVGFVDISEPTDPYRLSTREDLRYPYGCGVIGEYVLVTDYETSELAVIKISDQTMMNRIRTPAGPGAMAVSPGPNRAYAVLIYEGESQQVSPGLGIVDTARDVGDWTVTNVSFNLSGVDGATNTSTPYPVEVSIKSSVAVVTFEENNAIGIVDLASKSVSYFAAGSVSLSQVDATYNHVIRQTDTITVAREPRGVAWISDGAFATADVGKMPGARSVTVYNTVGEVLWTSGSTLELEVVRIGHFNEYESDVYGVRPRGAFYGKFGTESLLFITLYKAGAVLVYRVNDAGSPQFLQALPAGVDPKCGVAIPSRDLSVVLNSRDARDDAVRASITIYKRFQGPATYPTLISSTRADGTPIPFSSLSGLAAGVGDKAGTLYAIEDAFSFKKNRILEVDTATTPPTVVAEIRIKDTNGVLAAMRPYGSFDASERDALLNGGGTVNVHGSGIAVAGRYFFIAVEGYASEGDVASPNVLLKVDGAGKIREVIGLPVEVAAMQRSRGFGGVVYDSGVVYVTFREPWGDEANPRIGMYDETTGLWSFVFYEPDAGESQLGGNVFLDDIAPFGNQHFLVIERDGHSGPDAAITRIYKIDLSSAEPNAVVSKTLYMDLDQKLKEPGGLLLGFLSGLAVLPDGSVWIVNNNYNGYYHSGETQLMMITGPTPTVTPRPYSEESPARRGAALAAGAALWAATLASLASPAS